MATISWGALLLCFPGSCRRAEHPVLPGWDHYLSALWVFPSATSCSEGESHCSSCTSCCNHSLRISLLQRGRIWNLLIWSVFWGGGHPPSFSFLFFKFYLEGEEKEGWHGVGAVDVIKAPAEQICGSGVSTSEKSMAAAVAVLAVLQGLPLQECSKASSTSVSLSPFFILYLLSAKWPDSPRFTEVD